MDRPVSPDPTDIPRIRRAIRAARFMKWGAAPIIGILIFICTILGISAARYLGVLAFLISCGAFLLFGYSRARCPRCGQVWWGRTILYAPLRGADKEFQPLEDETESFVCRRCRVDIGVALRK